MNATKRDQLRKAAVHLERAAENLRKAGVYRLDASKLLHITPDDLAAAAADADFILAQDNTQ